MFWVQLEEEEKGFHKRSRLSNSKYKVDLTLAVKFFISLLRCVHLPVVAVVANTSPKVARQDESGCSSPPSCECDPGNTGGISCRVRLRVCDGCSLSGEVKPQRNLSRPSHSPLCYQELFSFFFFLLFFPSIALSPLTLLIVDFQSELNLSSK